MANITEIAKVITSNKTIVGRIYKISKEYYFVECGMARPTIVANTMAIMKKCLNRNKYFNGFQIAK